METADRLRARAQEIAASLPPMTDAEIRRAAALAARIDARRGARVSADSHAGGIEACRLTRSHD